VALKKPSDFFGENNKDSFDSVQEEVNSADSKNILKIQEGFNKFKGDYKEVNDFVLTFESFKQNVEKIDNLYEAVDLLKEDINSFASKEELDSAIMAQLLFVEKSVDELKKNVRATNSKTILEIKNNFQDLESSVNDFLSVDVPHHKKSVKESEIRVDKKLDKFKVEIDENFEFIQSQVSSKLLELSENLKGINQNNLLSVYERIEEVSDDLNNLLKKEFPKFNKVFVESELKIEKKVSEIDSKIVAIDDKIDAIENVYEGRVSSLKKTIDTFVEEEIPKYKKIIVESKLNSESEIKDLENLLKEKIQDFSKSINLLEENNNTVLNDIRDEFSTSKEKIDSISKTYENLYKDFKNREISENKKLESFSQEISSLKENLNNDLESYSNDSKIVFENFESDVEDLRQQIENKISTLKICLEENILSTEKNIKEQDTNIEIIKVSLKNLASKVKEEVVNETSSKFDEKISYLEEALQNLKEKTFLKEETSLLTGLPSNKTEDPLTPLDQKFVTFEDLASHYRTFINRVQIQMASIGGGGAGFIKDLDDVEFDTSTGDGKLLIYDQARSKWVGIASTALIGSGGGGNVVGAGGTWQVDSVGIHTTKNVGIGTTANVDYKLYVNGDAFFTGNVSVAGTVTYDDVTNVDSLGIITARQDVRIGRNLSVVGITTLGSSNGIGTVTVGIGQTALYVDGDARVVGILTVGRASITLDGTNNTITAGDILITGSSITIGENVTINAGATGINSAPNVIYVAKDGNDANNGTSIDNAKLTIAGAVSIAQSGTTVKVLSGTYIESNPIVVPPFVSIVGDSLKTVTIIPSNATQDIFHLNKGTYLSHMTFTGHTAPAAAVAFPVGVATNVGGGDWESPYVQNCTSNTTTGTGMRIDGNRAEGLKSMVVDAYTQYNQGGVGIAITNNGYAQLVSVFTICCNEAITAHKGGQCSLTNSNTDFGTYGLVADGVSDIQFSGIVTSSSVAGQDRVTVAITTSTRPYQGQVVYFGNLYYSIDSITVTNGGSGYTATPTVSVEAPTGPNGSTATAFATLNGGSVESITIITSGNQYLTSPTITISAPDSGTTATAQANLTPIYYTINSSTPVTAGITTLTLDENLINSVGVGTTINFYQVSKITATSHTFEYVGSGNTITTATPARGGVAIQENEIIETNGGRVTFTSTDQAGNFRIGNDIVIDQNTGTISGRAFTRSLFSEMTPFILALS
jgi:hypothetical protein